MSSLRSFAFLLCTSFFLFGGMRSSVAQQGRPADANLNAKIKRVISLTEQANKLRHAGDHLAALPLFEEAYRLVPGPATATRLGMCELALQRFVEAEAHLAEALASPDDPWLEKNRPAILSQMQLLKTLLGWIEIAGRPSGAQVEVEGRVVGALPLDGPVRVLAGRVFVRVSADGYHPLRQAVDVKAGETARAVVELEAMAAPIATVSPNESSRSGSNPMGLPPPPREAMPLPVYQDPPGSWKRPAGWVSATVAAVLGAGGTTAALISRNKINEFNSTKTAPSVTGQCNRQLPSSGGGKCPALLKDSEDAKKIATVALIGAGAAALSAVVLFATTPNEPPYPRTSSGSPRLAGSGPRLLACGPTLTGPGASCAFTF